MRMRRNVQSFARRQNFRSHLVEKINGPTIRRFAEGKTRRTLKSLTSSRVFDSTTKSIAVFISYFLIRR
jgi:hypothetical protein